MSTSPDRLVRSLRAQLAREHGDATLIETHISWVLLAGEWAYKIKKPVRLSFLDFSTLAARKRYCDEELRLNRRLAPALYLDVVPITGTADAPHFDAAGVPIEYAVSMRRFAAGSLASERLAHGTLEAAVLDRFAQRLAAFHAAGDAAPAGGEYGTPQRIEADIALLLAEWPQPADAPVIDEMRQWFAAHAAARGALAAQRLAAGRVRECHGDLHLDNLALVDGELIAFDCLEFDAGLRWIDVASELAFVLMDLKARGHCGLAHRFADAYLEAGGDHAALPLLRTYEVYRALVRARVARLREVAAAPSAGAPGAAAYLALAQRFAQQWEPRLLITHGLPGAGKTWVTHQLLQAAGAVRLRSDVERRRLLGPDHYQRADSEAVYARLLALARLALQSGYPTIVDAAFLRRDERARFRALAAELGAPFTLLHCTAPDEVLRQRVRERTARGADASQADETVLALLRERVQAPIGDEANDAIVLDTSLGNAAGDLARRWSSR